MRSFFAAVESDEPVMDVGEIPCSALTTSKMCSRR